MDYSRSSLDIWLTDDEHCMVELREARKMMTENNLNYDKAMSIMRVLCWIKIYCRNENIINMAECIADEVSKRAAMMIIR